jgi:hypothetical protein
LLCWLWHWWQWGQQWLSYQQLACELYKNNTIPNSTLCNMLYSGFYIYNTLDMTNNDIVQIKSIGAPGTTPLNCNSILNMNSNNITGIGTISGSGLSDISITSGLNFTTTGGINCGGGSITNCNTITSSTGNFVTTSIPTTSDNSSKIATTSYVQSNLSVLGTTVSNPISSITGATFSSNTAFVYTIGDFTQVIITGLVVYCNTSTPYLTIFFNNNLYTPTKSYVALGVTGYFANSSNSVLQSFAPNSINTSFNAISIRANANLSAGQTYVTALTFNFYF